MAYLRTAIGNLLQSGIKPATAVTTLPALTSAAAAGATPTKAEHDAVVADLAATRTTVNDLVVKLRAAGFIAP